MDDPAVSRSQPAYISQADRLVALGPRIVLSKVVHGLQGAVQTS